MSEAIISEAIAIRLLTSLTLAIFPAAAQQTVPNPVSGFIEKIDGRSFRIGLLNFSAHEKLEVWKSRTLYDLSMLKVGDEVRVTWRSASGTAQRMAISIATATTMSGTVQDARPDCLEVRNTATNETRIIMLSPDTRYASDHRRIAVGEDVHIAGWDLGNGRVEARRIAVYNLDTPLDPVVVR